MRIFNNGRGGLAALIAAIAGLALALTGCSTNPAVQLSDDMKTLLTVTDSSASCTKIVEKAKGNDAVINGVYKLTVEATTSADKRYVSTSPGLALKGKTDKAQHADIELTLCTDPLQGGEFAHWLAHATIQDTTILSLNDWLSPFNIDIDQVSAYVQTTYLPNFGKDSPTDEDYQAQATATRAYAEFASKLVTMLNRFQSYDTTSAKSTLNYSLAGGGAVVGKVPPLQLNPNQESLKAKRYALTEKDQCKPLLVFGFNVHDKRVEQFNPPNECSKGTPKPPATTTKTPPTTHHHPKPKCKPTKCLEKKHGSNPGLNKGTNEKNTVNNNDGASDSKGLQTDPQGDAEKAKKAADAANQAKKDEANQAASNADTDSGGGSGDHGAADPPDSGW
jgi:hypothetical protein